VACVTDDVDGQAQPVEPASDDGGATDGGIRVAIVDDDPLVRAGLAMILNGSHDIEIVGEAADGAAGISLVDDAYPDVVLMDIRMPHMDGLEATATLSTRPDPPAVIVLTTFDADEYVVRALRDGATGFLLKDTPPAAIVDAVRKVADGEPMLSPSVTAQLIRRLSETSTVLPDDRARVARARLGDLSDREREVALAVGAGKANAEIARELYMSVATVKAHVSRILTKLDATNRVQIAICVHDAELD
jgi:DNA-binding NarL/FixJ family response regulator